MREAEGALFQPFGFGELSRAVPTTDGRRPQRIRYGRTLTVGLTLGTGGSNRGDERTGGPGGRHGRYIGDCPPHTLANRRQLLSQPE